MSLASGARWSSFLRSGKNLKIGWVITAFVVALYAGIIRPQERNMGINNSRASGLAAERMEPLGLWHQTRIAGLLAGIPDADKSVNYIPNAVRSVADSRDSEADRKMVRTATLEMLVQHPAETAEKIRVLAEREGGYLVSSEVRGQEYPVGGTLTIRVPAERFENVRDQIRKLGLRVESERPRHKM